MVTYIGSPGKRGSPCREYSGEGPRNYLLKGGNRAVEKANADKLAKLSKSAMRVSIKSATHSITQQPWCYGSHVCYSIGVGSIVHSRAMAFSLHTGPQDD
jgi:hypothetical protein